MNTHFAIAVHALAVITYEGGGPVSAARIADSVGTSPVFLRRVLADLRDADLIAMRRGANGGAELLVDATAISLADIYDAVTTNPLLSIHDAPNPACAVGRGVGDALDVVVATVEEDVRARLAQRTVHQVLQEILAAR
ncbi:Rrf2 family transcriptional regulator [Euzebya tangerina]|uniref:Rrf2 family transcriptional regulator n=1 Tax=Euzebya tangerina TaxID=591198 RepID=UPI0013C32334|nr:Rrf2 family transcriptional regulator [Euzebya tangerina]